uniref:Uncharacterized protein n=1 Tax=Janibacter limosus TaxID=53458 RepID=A0AC61U4S7_9MICO|nr:hypothetical protein [Janibacter limosus]
MRTAALTAVLSLPLTGCGLLPQGGSPGSSTSAPTSQGASDQPTEDLGTLTGAGRPPDEGGCAPPCRRRVISGTGGWTTR